MKVNDEKQLPLLDILDQNDESGLSNFKVYKKEATTKVQLEHNSYIEGKVILGFFKGFLARAWRICSEKHRNEEFKFLITVFSKTATVMSLWWVWLSFPLIDYSSNYQGQISIKTIILVEWFQISSAKVKMPKF